MILRKVTRTAPSITLGQHYIRGHLTLRENHFNSSDAPQYINDVVKIHTPARFTRSCESVAIKSDFKAKLKSAGERAIDHYFPKLWNDLPASLKNHCNLTTFKSNLKTYLFRQHFN